MQRHPESIWHSLYLKWCGNRTAEIHPDAVRPLKQPYGTDMEQAHDRNLLNKLLSMDAAAAAGRCAARTVLPCKHWEDWALYRVKPLQMSSRCGTISAQRTGF